MSATAKLFMHGRSQAVRLPKEFGFEGTEVRVSKVGDKVILEPLKKAIRRGGVVRASRRTRRAGFPA
jgi:virulence-associated protein VagC